MHGRRLGLWRRGAPALLVVAAAICAPSAVCADEDEAPAIGRQGEAAGPFYALDTKNLFGFLEGADVGEAGEKSLEFETTGAGGGAGGRFQSVEQEFIFEPTLTDSLGLEFGAHVLGQNVRGVPDLPDFTGVDFMGLSVEARYVVKHRSAGLADPGDFDGRAGVGRNRRRRAAHSRFQLGLSRDCRLAERRPAPLRRRQSRLHPRRRAPAGAGMGKNLDLRRVGGPLISRDAAADVRRRGRLRPRL